MICVYIYIYAMCQFDSLRHNPSNFTKTMLACSQFTLGLSTWPNPLAKIKIPLVGAGRAILAPAFKLCISAKGSYSYSSAGGMGLSFQLRRPRFAVSATGISFLEAYVWVIFGCVLASLP